MPRTYTRAPLAERFWSKVDKSGECWIYRGATNRGGYGVFGVSLVQGERTNTSAHRMAWILTNGPIADGQLVCHHCDVRNCVRPDHLFLGSAYENTQDMIAKGRDARGERRGNAKLTAAKVAVIRAIYALGEHSCRDIGDFFGVSPSNIHLIVTGQAWPEAS